MKKKAYILSHTHWDREWYQPYESFRFRLVKMLDEILKILLEEGDYRFFNLDGQTVVLEDYLEIKPENSELLKELIKKGKIGIGPWYVQADEFLSDGEAIIRNLLIGKESSQAWGGTQKICYLPDTFGHNSQIPQILRGFSIETALLWRGVSGDDWSWEFLWEGADGSRLFTYRLPERLGYCNSAFTPDGEKVSIEYLKTFIDKVLKRSVTEIAVLMDGCDHKHPNTCIGKIIEMLSLEKPEIEFSQVLLNDFSIEFLRRCKENIEKLRLLKGELREVNRSKDGYFNYILPNVLSSRAKNKRENFDALNWVESYAEPLSVLAFIEGKEYPEGFLKRVWKLILKNLAHDSIGGCSADQVHRDVSSRYARAIEICKNISFDSLAYLSDTNSDTARENAVVIYNPSQFETEGALEIEFDLLSDTLDVKRELILKDEKGKQIPACITNIKKQTKALSYRDGSAPIFEVYSVKALVDCSIQGNGFKTLNISSSEKVPLNHDVKRINTEALANEFLEVRLIEGGKLKITEKSSGKSVITNVFEDTGDNGDGYVYSRPAFDRAFFSNGSLKSVSCEDYGLLGQLLRAEYELLIPCELEAGGKSRSTSLKPLRIVSEVLLKKDSRRVDFRVKVHNGSRNHRLRVYFLSENIGSNAFFYKTPFDIVIRPKKVSDNRISENWIEDQPSVFPNGGVFGEIKEREQFSGYSIATRGIPEFEPVKEGVALTLFRAVGHIGSPYTLSCMTRNAGPAIETAEAQMLGELCFEYAFFFMDTLEQVIKQSSLYSKRPLCISRAGKTPVSPVNFTARYSELTALKKAEKGDGIILRCANLSSNQDNIEITLSPKIEEAWLCSLSEEPLEKLEITDGKIELSCKPKKILTIKLRV
ncbi:hypothetical protein AT15_05620 [Kosmotoga arenicorallina S304]|uniref:Glycoside hydrolase family 38 central domain-containing protein n=1 Tax=Kosmotoga arenicorallina S304 TaxID=1453497 RepID=A0A176K388_9BACT|nr:glycosyl hydrolase-related protein [Kosmotoga arenicorallina]OAA31552.1 hypothetical protein AT15_05620 [Kosmotoga arenicorallina S304]